MGRDASQVNGRHASPDVVLLGRLYPALRRFAAVASSAREDPDDLVQEALARTLTLHRLEDLDDPGAYLRTVVANLAKDRGRDRSAPSPCIAGSAEVDVYPSDLALLDELSAAERIACFVVDLERRPLAELAAALDCSLSTAKVRLASGRRKLKRLYRREER